MYNSIIIKITRASVDPEMKVKDIPKYSFGDPITFNYKEAHLKGVREDFVTDSLLLKFVHPDFPETLEGGQFMEYTIEDARERFPFMFIDDFDVTERYIDI